MLRAFTKITLPGALFVLVVLAAFSSDAQTVPPKSRGCFADTGDRDLSGFLGQVSDNTPNKCIELCRTKNFPYAATQAGNWCACGTSYGKYGTSTACTMPCPGDKGTTCGGGLANQVYVTNPGPSSTEPVGFRVTCKVGTPEVVGDLLTCVEFVPGPSQANDLYDGPGAESLAPVSGSCPPGTMPHVKCWKCPDNAPKTCAAGFDCGPWRYRNALSIGTVNNTQAGTCTRSKTPRGRLYSAPEPPK